MPLTTLDRAVIVSLVLMLAVSVALPLNWEYRPYLGPAVGFAGVGWYVWWRLRWPDGE